MKKNVMRLLSVLLVVLMTLPLVIACKDTANEATNGENGPAQSEDKYRDDLPEDMDFGGEDVNFLSRSFDWYVNELTVESGDTSDIVDAAVWRRQMNVEQRIGINMVNTMLDGDGTDGYALVTNAIREEILAGTNDYDIGVNNLSRVFETVTEGLFWNMNKVPNVDLSKPYYSQNFNYTSTIEGKQFAVTGDAALTFIKFAFATFFNRNMAENQKIPDLYQTVLNGDWTFEYQGTLVKELYTDGNSNSKKDESDTFGLLTNSVLGVDPYWSAFDLPLITKNAAGKAEVTVNVDKMTNSLKMINQLFWQSQGVYVAPHVSNDGELETAAQMFAADQGLFMTNRLYACETEALRNMESLYGIIPMPKFEKAQEQYYSYCHDLMSVYVISAAVPETRLAMVGAALECLFSESLECRTKLFEEALKVKYQSTEKTGQMLDIIIDHMKLDTGIIYSRCLGRTIVMLRDMVQKRSSSWAGFWKMNVGAVTKQLGDIEESFKKIKS